MKIKKEEDSDEETIATSELTHGDSKSSAHNKPTPANRGTAFGARDSSIKNEKRMTEVSTERTLAEEKSLRKLHKSRDIRTAQSMKIADTGVRRSQSSALKAAANLELNFMPLNRPKREREEEDPVDEDRRRNRRRR